MKPPALFDLAGKVAVVTGAAQGLGEVIAQALTEHGAHTVLLDINTEAVAAATERISSVDSPGSAEWTPCDVTNREQVIGCSRI